MNIIYNTTKTTENQYYIQNYVNISEKKKKECIPDKISLLCKKQQKMELKHKFINLLSNLNEINFNNFNNFKKYLEFTDFLDELLCYFNQNQQNNEHNKNIHTEILNSIEKLEYICIDMNRLLDLLGNIKEVIVKTNSSVYNTFDKKLLYDELYNNILNIQEILCKHCWINDCILEDNNINSSTFCEKMLWVSLHEKSFNISIIDFFIHFTKDNINCEYLCNNIEQLTCIIQKEKEYISILLKQLQTLDTQINLKNNNINNIINLKKEKVKIHIEKELLEINNTIEYISLCMTMS